MFTRPSKKKTKTNVFLLPQVFFNYFNQYERYSNFTLTLQCALNVKVVCVKACISPVYKNLNLNLYFNQNISVIINLRDRLVVTYCGNLSVLENSIFLIGVVSASPCKILVLINCLLVS